MGEYREDKKEELRRYMNVIERQASSIVRPYRADGYREDGYVNVLNKYGTHADTTEHYYYERDPEVPDMQLLNLYETNGLFAKIIDAPAEEAVKHGFKLKGADEKVQDIYKEVLNKLEFDELSINCLKFTRLFGGAIAVMLIDDGRGLDEPLDWKNIQSIDDIRVYDRSIAWPDYSTIYRDASYGNPFEVSGSKLGYPEFYNVYSIYGSFRVHESRCLIFRNGIISERASNMIYRMWGVPEYMRLRRALRDSEIAHGSAVKLLDRAVQAVYTMKGLTAELATEGGEDRVLQRLQMIDMARGLMNTITIDGDGEDYSFRQFSFSGVAEVIDTTCNYLSSLSNIPQTILFGRSPAGMNATGKGDLENWYNYVERFQNRTYKNNVRYLLAVIFQAALNAGEIDKPPILDVEFNPLWSMSEEEKMAVEQQKANVAQTRASTAQAYIDMQVLDPSEVRKALAKDEEFDVETMLDDYTPEELEENAPSGDDDMMGMMGGAGGAGMPGMPGAEGPEDGGEEAGNGPVDLQKGPKQGQEDEDDKIAEDEAEPNSVGILVVKDGKVLVGRRMAGDSFLQVSGPGGKIEPGETPEQAARRETKEEFGITPILMIPIGIGETEENGNTPAIYLCTSYDGEVTCGEDGEMASPRFYSLDELKGMKKELFKPFNDSLSLFMHTLYEPINEPKPGLKKLVSRVFRSNQGRKIEEDAAGSYDNMKVIH